MPCVDDVFSCNIVVEDASEHICVYTTQNKVIKRIPEDLDKWFE